MHDKDVENCLRVEDNDDHDAETDSAVDTNLPLSPSKTFNQSTRRRHDSIDVKVTKRQRTKFQEEVVEKEKEVDDEGFSPLAFISPIVLPLASPPCASNPTVNYPKIVSWNNQD